MKRITVFALMLSLTAPLWAGTTPNSGDMYKQLERAIIRQARLARTYQPVEPREEQTPQVFFNKTFMSSLDDFQKNAFYHVLDDQKVIVGFDNLHRSYQAMRSATKHPFFMQEYIGQLDITLNTGKTHKTVAEYMQKILDTRANKGAAYRRHYDTSSQDREVTVQEAVAFKKEMESYKQHKLFISTLGKARTFLAGIEASHIIPHTIYTRGDDGRITAVTQPQELGPVALVKVAKPVEQLTANDKIFIKVTLRELLPLVKAIYPMLESAQERRDVATYLAEFPLQTSDNQKMDVANFLATYGPVYDDKEDFEQEEELGGFLKGFGEVLVAERTAGK